MMSDILIQYAVRKMAGRRIVSVEVPLLFLFLFMGVAITTVLFVRATADRANLFAGTVALYASLALGYFQCKSLFSRGYSIRILVDLLEHGGPDTVAHMKASYGGRGLSGMMVKRLGSMAAFGLLNFDGAVVGPITVTGRIVARFVSAYRRLLRLENVG